MVQDCAPSPSLATVYSALETFCRVGLARKLPTTEGSSRYDAATRDHVHVRFAESGAVEDVPRELSESVLESVPRAVLDEIEQRLGVRITGVDIQLTARRQPAT